MGWRSFPGTLSASPLNIGFRELRPIAGVCVLRRHFFLSGGFSARLSRGDITAADPAAGGQRDVADEEARLEAGTPRAGDDAVRVAPVTVISAG